MIPRIKQVVPLENYMLHVTFDDGNAVLYDVKDDIKTIPQYENLMKVYGLFKHVQVDKSRTVIFWNEDIDLSSDIIYEYGKRVK